MDNPQHITLIFNYKKNNSYALNVVLGALGTALREDLASIRLATSRDQIIKDISEAHSRNEVVVVAWSFYSPAFVECVKELADIRASLGEERVLHIAGGVHATAEPEQTLRSGFDLVAIGEGEKTIIDLVSRLTTNDDILTTKGIAYIDSNGKYISNGTGDRIDLNDFPPFATRQRRFNPIEITRGCLYACKFCQTPFMFKAKFRHRTVENICHYVRVMVEHNLTDVRFITPTSLSYGSPDESVHIDQIEELLSSIRGVLGNKGRIFFGTFPSEVRPEHVSREVLMVLRRYVANNNLIIGGQSGSDRILRTSGRGHTVEDIVTAVRLAVENGFLPNVDFIFGLPGETKTDVRASLDLARKLCDMGARIHGHTFMPLPGTPFKNAPPGRIDRRAMRELEALVSRGKLYGNWTQQVDVAKELAEIRTPPKNSRITW